MPTLKRSLNEIFTTLRKTAVGAGYSPGVAEEIGKAGVWLCARGQDGVGSVLAAVSAGPEGSVTPRFEGAAAVFGPGPAAMAGLAALDLLLSGRDIQQVRFESADAPMLIAGLAGTRARETGLTVIAEVGGVAENIAECDFERIVQATAMTLFLGDRAVSADGDEHTDGAEVGAAAWAACKKLAARTHVPASEQSRIMGAGANLTDND